MPVRYLMRAGSLEGEFREDSVRLQLLKDNGAASQVSMRLLKANKGAAILGGGLLKSHTNYLLGNDPSRWHRRVPNYSEVRYNEIYSGTDLVFYGNGDSLEHDFKLRPGANPSDIAFRLEGAESVELGLSGDLQIELPGGGISFGRPVAYQDIAGERRPVDAAFVLDSDGTVRFKLGSYDREAMLVIDPILTFATYLSPLASAATLIGTDASGSNYVAGYGSLGFPVTTGGFSGCASCTSNAVVTFVSKLSADGTSLLYSTVLGGNSFAQPTGLAVDLNGNVLVSGFTGASDFPTRNGQPIAPPNNAYLGYLISLSADGSSLNYGTMLGSPPSVSPAAMTYATALAVDSSGNAYVTGQTGDGFFTTPGALSQAAASGSRNNDDIFLAKFSPSGSLVYSAVLGTADPQNGGAGSIGATSLTVDGAGHAFVAGQAGALWPVTGGAYLRQIAGPTPYAAPFVMEVAADATSLVYSTFLDYANAISGISVLANGSVFVTGNGAGASYPTTPGAYQQNSGGGGAFLTELNASGSGLVYSTIFGDRTYQVHGLAVDSSGDIWLAGQTSKPQFPLVGPVQGVFPPHVSGQNSPASLLAEFDPTGVTLKFSSFLGGAAAGYASSVAVDPQLRAHVAGAAAYGMYTTPGVYDGAVPVPGPAFSGSTYAYVALVDPNVSGATVCLGGGAGAGLSFGSFLPQTSASQNLQVTNCGTAPLALTSITSNNAVFTVPAGSNGCTGSVAVGSTCTVGVQFHPVAVQAYAGQLTLTSNASVATTSLSVTGVGAEPVAAFGAAPSFAPTLVGQTSPAAFVMLSNNGQLPLTFDLQQIVVTSGFALSPGGNCQSLLTPLSSCSIAVVFTPKTTGTINGTLSVTTNDPVHPTLSMPLAATALGSYPVPTITGLQNPSFAIGGAAALTMSVYGTNFFPASVVYINGVAQTTSYQSSSFLQATFAGSVVNTVGEIPVTVANPAPGGGSSAPYPLIGYRSIPLVASALTVDPASGLLYAAIASTAPQGADTIVPIDPATGATKTPIAVAPGPRALAISDDGTELYVASTGVLQRINLQTLALEKTFNLPVDSQYGQTYAREMHIVPGSPKSIVVELFANVSSAEDGVALYNDSGLVNWLPGVSAYPHPVEVDSFAFTDASSIYALPFGGSFFSQVQVAPGGLSINGLYATGFNQQNGSIVRSDGTLLYTNSGQVWDPLSKKLLGTYTEANGSQISYAPSVVPDTTNHRTYFLDSQAQAQGLGIDVYDQATYMLLGNVPLTGIYSPEATDLVRWGTNGFAFRTTDISGLNSAADQIVILTSKLIASGNAAPAPVLASVAPATIHSGGAAFTMQLTGSGFTSASTVLVNGTPRVTTYLSGSSLNTQILATDIAVAGMLAIQVANSAPGGGSSNILTVPITAPAVVTPTVTVSASASSLTTAQPLTITVAVTGGSTRPTPTGSVVVTAGGYTSGALQLSGGSASLTIAPGSLAVGTSALTAAYQPDSMSAAVYSNATSTVSITITAPPRNLATVTVAAASTPITDLMTDTISVSVAGSGGQAAPTGTVMLTSGTYTALLTLTGGAGSAIVPAGTLSSGTNTLTASYSGDAAYSPASGAVVIMVAPIVLSAGNPYAITAGGSATANLTLSTGSNYSGTLNFGCALASSPSGAQSPPICSVNPTSASPAAGGTVSTALTVKTTAASTAALLVPGWFERFAGPGGGAILAGLLLLRMPSRRRRWAAMTATLWIVLAYGFAGCSVGSTPGGSGLMIPPTTAGVYKFTVTAVDATSSSISASTSVTVTVQ